MNEVRVANMNINYIQLQHCLKAGKIKREKEMCGGQCQSNQEVRFMNVNFIDTFSYRHAFSR